MTNSFYAKQISNRNYLSPTGFKFNLAKTPKVDFFPVVQKFLVFN